jgi:cobalt/nickel transport system permease protein
MSQGGWSDVGRMDELGRLDTPVHRVDARAKLVTTGLFIVAVMSVASFELAALTTFFI